MEDILKVLMMGGQRAGKTSVLSGLVDTMVNGDVQNLVSVQDITALEGSGRNLAKHIESLKYHLLTSQDKTFLIDDNKTSAFDNYVLQFAIPGTSSEMNIKFTDANGEFFDMGRSHDLEIRELVEQYDVFVIAIDTPFLMEAVNPDNKLCNEAINNSYNHVNDIHDFLTSLDDKNGADAKLVIFAPLKCEKWAKEGRYDEVVQRVEQVYESTLLALSKYVNVEVDIMPIQTVGSIVFVEQLKALMCSADGGKPIRSAVIDNKTKVRFEDGRVEDIDMTRHKFSKDQEAVIREGSILLRPNSWFKTIEKNYDPHNCDQLAFYVLQFYLGKVLFAQKVEDLQKNKSRWKWAKIILTALGLPCNLLVGDLFAPSTATYLSRKFRTITIEQMQTLMKKIQDGGYVKINCEGIKTIQSSKLYSLK